MVAIVTMGTLESQEGLKLGRSWNRRGALRPRQARISRRVETPRVCKVFQQLADCARISRRVETKHVHSLLRRVNAPTARISRRVETGMRRGGDGEEHRAVRISRRVETPPTRRWRGVGGGRSTLESQEGLKLHPADPHRIPRRIDARARISRRVETVHQAGALLRRPD